MKRGGLIGLTLLSWGLPSRAAAGVPALHEQNAENLRRGTTPTIPLGGCFEIGVDYPGNDIKEIVGGVVGLPQLCQAICAETPNCDLFTWDSRTSNCYLKRANARDYRQRDPSTAPLISGPKECNSSYYGVCLEFNVDYEGHDVEQISDNNVFSAAHCQLLCEQKPVCFFFTWQSQTRTCYLKGPKALLGRKRSTSGGLLVSGPKRCWIGMPEKNLCFEYGVDYYGYDIDSLQTLSRETPEHCQLACQQEPACFYWSWEPTATGNHCFLKDRNALKGLKSDITTHHFVSGPKTCSPSVCFERDVDYMGADIQKIEDGSIHDAAACQRTCAQTKGCTFFTYVPARHWCYLKGHQALLGWRKDEQSQGSISGPRECMNPNANSKCYEQDVSYEGHTLVEIENGKVTSASMCQQFCAHYGLCTHWTWDSRRFYCYLRSASALLGWKRDQSTHGFVSGPKNCHQSVLAGCQENNFDYMGHDIAKYEDRRARTSATCQTLCQVTASCAYWTWSKETQACYLKDKTALEGRKEVSKELGLASGPKFCSISPPGCFEVDVDYSGHNIAKMESGRCSSAPVCQSLCQKTTGCLYWTWVSATKSCYLKNIYATHARRSDIETGGMVSGPAFCPRQPACTENGVDLTGYDVEKIEDGQITSPELCRSLCQQCTSCTYWSWVRTTQSCYLKNNYGLLGRREGADTKDMVSGPKYCCPLPPICYERGYTYMGHDIVKIETGSVYSADTCRGFCQTDPDCYFWTWDQSTRNCYLKDQYAPIGRTPSPHTISGSWECSNHSAGSCVEEEVTYEGRDLLGPSASATRKFQSFGDQYNGALICQMQCHATPGCHYWSFDRAGQRCYLKDEHAPGGRIRNPATKHFISGHKDCVPKAADCHEVDVDYRGFDFRKIETQQVWTYQMCQELCRATDGCHFWTWDGKANNCYLKTEQAVIGRTRDHNTIGLISGPKHCQMTVSCFETDVEYTGYTLQQLENGFLQTAAQCQAVCKLRPRCEYWTWISASKGCHLKTAGALNGRKKDRSTTGMISGPKTCTASPECYEIDIDYYGNDVQKIENGSVSSSGECQHLCQLHPDCYYFTFLTDLKFCYLKSFGAAGNKVAQVSAVSGPKSCSVSTCTVRPSPPPPAGCSPRDCHGPARPAVCACAQCNKLPPSHSCTQGGWGSRLPPPCVNYPASGWPKPLPPPTNCTCKDCGKQPRPPTVPLKPPPQSTECFEHGVVYVADSLPEVYRAESVAECHHICVKEPRAKAFSYHIETSECVLKVVSPYDQRTELFSKLPVEGVISGPKHCRGEAVPTNPDIPVVQLSPPPLPSVPPEAPPRPSPDVPAPHPHPAPPPECPAECQRPPPLYNPEDLYNQYPPPVNNPDDSYIQQPPLVNNPGDSYIQHPPPVNNPDDLYNNCYVIAIEYGGTNLPVSDNGATHGASAAPVHPHGSPIQHQSLSSAPYVKEACPESCQKRCMGYPACFYWSFEVDTGRCFLKGADAVRSGIVNVHVVSGPKYCA